MPRTWLRKFWPKPTSFSPVILVTGCSSGIGLALARRLVKHPRYRVVITCRERSLAKLKEKFTETDRFLMRAMDVTVATDRKHLIREINERWGGVNVLVNNAGISYRSVVEHMTEDDEHRQMETNYFGPLGLIRLVLPNMRAHGRGKIINISSVSGMMAMPTMASYSASKYALEGASEALWYETKPFGIDVCLIQPGFIHSDAFEHVIYTEQSRPEHSRFTPYSDYYANMTPFVAKLMNLAWATPESVAALIERTIHRSDPPLWIPATFDAKVFYYIRRLLPRRIMLPILFACLPNARTWGMKYSRKQAE